MPNMPDNESPLSPHDTDDDEPAMLAAEEGEEIYADEDATMLSDSEGASESEVQLQNDSIAHFDAHSDSIFCIAQHPVHSHIIATGGGDHIAYIFDRSTSQVTRLESPLQASGPRNSISSMGKLEGHTDSVNAVAFGLPHGDVLFTAGLDGQLRAWKERYGRVDGTAWTLLAQAREVDEINFLVPCPHPSRPNNVAIGASDGSIWLYSVDVSDSQESLQFVTSFHLHQASATAGAWSPDGSLLVTVSEDGSLYVWDAFGDASSVGMAPAQGSQYLVGLTANDERFRVDGGLYSLAISPNGAYAAVGGAEGHIRMVGLPRLGVVGESATMGSKSGVGSIAKVHGGKQTGVTHGHETSTGQAGQILASLQTQTDGVETLAFSPNPVIPLLAAGSVDGSIALFDTRNNFAVRKHIRNAHDSQAVIKVEFVGAKGAQAWTLTSCGNDGVLRRWDARGGSSSMPDQMLGQYKGHRGGGDGGGILGFVQGGDNGRYIVTAGDDAVSLIFNTGDV